MRSRAVLVSAELGGRGPPIVVARLVSLSVSAARRGDRLHAVLRVQVPQLELSVLADARERAARAAEQRRVGDGVVVAAEAADARLGDDVPEDDAPVV